MALHEKILAGFDSTVTLVGMYHSESGLPGDPGNPNLPAGTTKVTIHYRPYGVIAHIWDAKGELLKRKQFKSGVQLRKHFGVKVPEPQF